MAARFVGMFADEVGVSGVAGVSPIMCRVAQRRLTVSPSHVSAVADTGIASTVKRWVLALLHVGPANQERASGVPDVHVRPAS